MSVNVNRGVTDQFYRYKMPRLIAKVGVNCLKKKISVVVLKKIIYILFFCKVEGKGNGIKTVIVNMVDVAKALNRPPTCEYCF